MVPVSPVFLLLGSLTHSYHNLCMVTGYWLSLQGRFCEATRLERFHQITLKYNMAQTVRNTKPSTTLSFNWAGYRSCVAPILPREPWETPPSSQPLLFSLNG